MAITPFQVNIAPEEVQRLKRKLVDTRIPQQPIVAVITVRRPALQGRYSEHASDIILTGPPIQWFHRLYKRWLEDFDWLAVQTHLNRHPHFLADVEHNDHRLRIHFTHTRSTRPDAISIILIHGWPGSFYEFDRIVDDLADPQDSSDPAFHVIVPSLPGFCWSSPPPKRGWTMKNNAAFLNQLMLQLGYTSYVVQAGDWGSFVARELGAQYPECKAVHLNFCPVEIGADENDLTPREVQVKARYQNWMDEHLGYAVCMRSRPQTIGVALADKPVGILSWVGEKFIEAAAPTKLEDSEWDERILITASLYYFSDCVMTSMLPYYENVQHAGFGDYFLAEENYIGVPTGYTSFLYDTRPGTLRTARLTGNLVFYKECDEGGHFAALERPDVILQDCRTFFGEWFKP